MADSVTNTFTRPWAFRGLVGPVLRKELRVASRRRTHYLLRLAYVGLLCAVIFHFWHVIAATGGPGAGAGQVSRSGAVGQRVIVTIVWFQFVAAQVLAIVLLSSAISSEVRQRTLEGLLVTPLGAAQIVMGKLLSRLLQVILLLALGVPVLAVARVFGGVPWDYVVSSLCITLSASLFAGSVSLYYSSRYRHPHEVAYGVGYVYFFLCGLDIVRLLFWIGSAGNRAPWSSSSSELISPVSALLARTEMMLTGSVVGSNPAPVMWHCLLILGLAAVALFCAILRVRAIAVAPAADRTDELLADALSRPVGPGKILRLVFAGKEVRRVTDPPIVWKERGAPWFAARDQVVFRMGVWAAAILLGIPIAVGVAAALWTDTRMYHVASTPVWILHWVFLIRLGVGAAGSIAREKEARTWPVLLATPLDSGEIVWGKAFGILRRDLWLLLVLLALYPLIFLSVPSGGRDLPRDLVCVGAPVVHLLGITLFLLGAGFYAGLWCRTVTAATAYVFGAFLGLMLLGSQLPTGILSTPRYDHSGALPGTGGLSLLAALTAGAVGLLALWTSARALRLGALNERCR